MRLVRLALVVLPLFIVSGRLARGDELEPETGVFGGYGGPHPYELLLRRALFEDDRYRLCQFVVIPSFGTESAVYILQPIDGPPEVVSRTLKRQLWASMMNEMTKACPNGSIRLDAMAQIAALEKLRPMTEVRRAELSPDAAAALGATCRDVLLRVRYSKTPGLDFDGTTYEANADGTEYHAGHWIQGAFLSGTTLSPKKGSGAGEFVDLGEQLKLFAESKPASRAGLEAKLVARAKRLRRRLKSGR